MPFHRQGDFPDPEIEHGSLMSPALSGGFFTTSTTREGMTAHSGLNPVAPELYLSGRRNPTLLQKKME